jgi:tRNA-binding EMAP/Myf-like protein
MNSNHLVNVVRIKELRKHPNADNLSLVDIDGYQVVVRTEEFDINKLYAYIQPDSVVPDRLPYRFLWADREFPDGVVPERKRRITVRRFRKEYSEGLLLPLSEFGQYMPISNFTLVNGIPVCEGDDVAELLGVTHYVEPEPGFNLGAQGTKLTFWQKVLKFFGFGPKPYGPKNGPGAYDVESLKNYPRVFVEGEPVLVTEKIHGSNARYTFDGKKFWAGSHHRWWKEQGNIWWEVTKQYPWIEEFCRKFPGYTLRGEVTPTQKGYAYGFETEKQFFAFDVQREEGTYINKANLLKWMAIQRFVPVVYEGPYDAAKMKELAEGKSLVEGAKNIREGIVISSVEERTVRGVGRAQLKLKSLAFLEKENKQ